MCCICLPKRVMLFDVDCSTQAKVVAPTAWRLSFTMMAGCGAFTCQLASKQEEEEEEEEAPFFAIALGLFESHGLRRPLGAIWMSAQLTLRVSRVVCPALWSGDDFHGKPVTSIVVQCGQEGLL